MSDELKLNERRRLTEKAALERQILKLITDFQSRHVAHEVHVLSVTHNSDDTFVDIILKKKQ